MRCKKARGGGQLILFLPHFSQENQGKTQVLPVLPGMAPLSNTGHRKHEISTEKNNTKEIFYESIFKSEVVYLFRCWAKIDASNPGIPTAGFG